MTAQDLIQELQKLSPSQEVKVQVVFEDGGHEDIEIDQLVYSPYPRLRIFVED